MMIEDFSFGRIRIDGKNYDHDVVIDRGSIARRNKRPSKHLTEQFGHTPLSIKEDIPWNCHRLIIGTGAYGNLPVTDEIKREAVDRQVDLLMMPTLKAIEKVNESEPQTNAILHVTC